MPRARHTFAPHAASTASPFAQIRPPPLAAPPLTQPPTICNKKIVQDEPQKNYDNLTSVFLVMCNFKVAMTRIILKHKNIYYISVEVLSIHLNSNSVVAKEGMMRGLKIL